MTRLFGEKLRELRQHRGIVQADLVKHLGLSSQGYLAELEAGKEVASLELVLNAANFFEIPLDSLLKDSISPSSLLKETQQKPSTNKLSISSFGPQLRELRKSKSLSQESLALQLGLARQSYISNLESGRKLPSVDLVLRVGALFDIKTDELFLEKPT